MRALLIENRLERPESWKENKPYGCHLSLKQLQESELVKFRDRFDLIFEAMDIKPSETLKKQSIAGIRFKNESEKQTCLIGSRKHRVNCQKKQSRFIIFFNISKTAPLAT